MSIKAKKIPYYLFVGLFTVGASLILGLLSFTGMLGLYPILGLAIGTFVLSVAYEGEIYFQNIKGAFAKLFKNDLRERQLAKQFLLERLKEDNAFENAPEILGIYKAQLERLAQFSHKNLTDASLAEKELEEKKLSDIEKWMTLEIVQSKKRQDSRMALEFRRWLSDKELEAWLYDKSTLLFKGLSYLASFFERDSWSFIVLSFFASVFERGYGPLVIVFSIVASFFAGLGTMYLLAEAFGSIAFLAALPALPVLASQIMIPLLAVVAGIAYGLLVYNAVMDFINNETIQSWYKEFISDWKTEGFSLYNVLMTLTTVTLSLLAVALTVFTAGTWWSVVDKEAPFEWIKKIPTLAIGIVTGLTSFLFILQNTSETLKLVREWLKDSLTWIKERYEAGFKKGVWKPAKRWFSRLFPNENTMQKLNPFRILAIPIVVILRTVLFLGHLASIAFTADRMPGVPQIVSFFIAFISEGFEDAHYFLGHDHESHACEPEDIGDGHDHHHHEHGNHHHEDHQEHKPHQHSTRELLEERLGPGHGHSHDLDFPTKLIKGLVSPLYGLAALWDLGFRDKEIGKDKWEAFKVAFWKQWDNADKEEVHLEGQSPLTPDCKQMLISFKLKTLEEKQGSAWFANGKKEALAAINKDIRACDSDADLSEVLADAKTKPILNKHRFAFGGEKTATMEKVEALEQRYCLN